MSSDPARKIRRRVELERRAHAPRKNPGRARGWWLVRGTASDPRQDAAAERLAELLAGRRR
jgi:hypothetical protein